MTAKQQPDSGAWIFVAHSHRDLEKVRQIRNELEHRVRVRSSAFTRSGEGEGVFECGGRLNTELTTYPRAQPPNGGTPNADRLKAGLETTPARSSGTIGCAEARSASLA